MYKLGIIGVGKMGSAILNGVIENNLYTKDNILLVVRREDQMDQLETLGYKVTTKVMDAYSKCETLILAVKPQMFSTVFGTSRSYNFNKTTIISVAAGISIRELKFYFRDGMIIRAMPNTSAQIGKSVTTIASEDKLSRGYGIAKKVLSSIGDVVEIEESELDLTMPLNGCIPAYLYSFMKEFIECAVAKGIDEEKAKFLVVDSVIGAASLIKATDDDLDYEIEKVCSKGGTTIAGLEKLYDNSFKEAIEECYEACVERAYELSKKEEE